MKPVELRIHQGSTMTTEEEYHSTEGARTQVPPSTNKAATIVKMVEEGCDYIQLIATEPDISGKDLFEALMLAVRMKTDGAQPGAYAQHLAAIRAEWPRAYEKWTLDEDEQLRSMHANGIPVEEIAEVLQRQVSAIRSRLVKLSDADGDLRVIQ